MAVFAGAACSGGGAPVPASGGDAGRQDLGADERTPSTARARPSPAASSVDATFDAAASTVNGSAGCNLYNGPYTADGANLTFGQLATTMRACEAPPGRRRGGLPRRLGLVRDVHGHGRQADHVRRGRDASCSSTASPSRARSTGVTWHATGINNGTGGVDLGRRRAPIRRRSSMTAGTVSGNAGCNQYNGPAVVDGESHRHRAARLDPDGLRRRGGDRPRRRSTSRPSRRPRPSIVHGSTLELRDADGRPAGLVRGRLTPVSSLRPPGCREGTVEGGTVGSCRSAEGTP